MEPEQMLRSATFYNYIHFRSKQRLYFNEGSNFIIGENGSGKSGIYELIRRSLSKNLSTSNSSNPRQDTFAYNITKYDTKNVDLRSFIGDTKCYCCLLHAYDSSVDECYCCLLQFTKQITITKSKSVKLVVLNDTAKKNVFCYIDGLPDITEAACKKICESIQTLLICPEKEDAETIQNLEDQFNSDQIWDKNINSNIPEEYARDEHKCDKILEEISKYVIFTFSRRDTGPLQWSRSERIAVDYKEKNYSEASDRAEILQELLNSKDIDKNQEKDFFELLTFPRKYEFDIVEDKKISMKEDMKKREFLKCPEGILEAKQFSLLLSMIGIGTICLEEPDKGMHPQMVDRMCKLILREVKDKTILVISHNQAMINPWVFDRTFIARSIKRDDGYKEHKIIKPKCEGKELHFRSDEYIKKMFYSSCVLFVEGETDEIVIEGMIHFIHEDKYNIIRATIGEDEYKNMRRKLCSLQVIRMGGKSNAKSAKHLSDDIDTPYCFLLDKDKFVQKENKKDKSEENKRNKGEEKKHDKLVDTIIYHKESEGDEKLVENYKKKMADQDKITYDVQTVPDLFQHFTELYRNYNYKPFSSTCVNKEALELFMGDIDIEIYKNRIDDMRSDLQSRNVFFWKYGHLEDMINEHILKKPMQRIKYLKERVNAVTNRDIKKKSKQPREDSRDDHTSGEQNGIKFPVKKDTLKQIDSLSLDSLIELLLTTKDADGKLICDTESELMEFIQFLRKFLSSLN